MISMLPNFQFSIFNFQSKLNFLKFSIIFILFSIFFLLPSVAHANTIPQANNLSVANTNPDVPNNLHNWTQNVMIEVTSSLICQLAGVDPINPKQSCLGIDQKTGKIGFVQNGGGAIGAMGNMITMLYTPPLHTADYFKNLASNFGISKKTYAQNAGGTGFQSLTPLINIWSAFRNIVYLLLVIVFVVIGLAIMLRVKIDPRTVMTIQNQIPKIIVGILAVTFSFAIAGFLIDMMWVLIYLFYGIFNRIQGVNVQSLNPTFIQGQSALGAAGRMSAGGIFGIAHNAAMSIQDPLRSIIDIKTGALAIFNPFALFFDMFDPSKQGSIANWTIDVLSYVSGIVVFKNYLTIFGAIASAVSAPFSGIPVIGNAIKGAIDGIALNGTNVAAAGLGYAAFAGTEALLRNWLPYIIAYLIIFIALLSALFRLWFTLLMSYVEILLAVVLAPFWIIGGIIPGSPISLGGWLKSISANLLAFPATIVMFMLGKVFIDSFGNTQTQGQFVPPLIGNPGETGAIGSLIGIGIILMTPNVVSMLKATLKAPKTDMMGSIGKGLGVGVGIPRTAVTQTTGTIFAATKGTMPTPDEKGLPAVMRRIFGRM